jgi:hypothetical protein
MCIYCSKKREVNVLLNSNVREWERNISCHACALGHQNVSLPWASFQLTNPKSSLGYATAINDYQATCVVKLQIAIGRALASYQFSISAIASIHFLPHLLSLPLIYIIVWNLFWKDLHACIKRIVFPHVNIAISIMMNITAISTKKKIIIPKYRTEFRLSMVK